VLAERREGGMSKTSASKSHRLEISKIARGKKKPKRRQAALKSSSWYESSARALRINQETPPKILEGK
jgi:hypothetical protein